MKTRSVIIAIMLLFVLFVTGCTPAGVPSNPAADPTNPSPQPTATTTPVTDEKLTLNAQILDILAAAYNKLASEESIRMELNSITKDYLSTCKIPFEEIADEKHNNTVISVSTSGSKEKMVYLILLHTLTTEYKDCVHFVDEEYFDYPYNRPMIKLLFVSDGYLAAGYDTVKDYFLAIREGKCESPSDALLISFDTESISEYARSDTDDLWPKLFSAVTNKRQ